MDILIEHGKAHYLYPDGAPELHPSIVIVRDYVGDVQEGWDWDGTTFTAPVEPAPTAEEIRAMRDMLLDETDWVVVMASELGFPVSDEWKNYRQALRNITLQEGFPENVEWPTKP